MSEHPSEQSWRFRGVRAAPHLQSRAARGRPAGYRGGVDFGATQWLSRAMRLHSARSAQSSFSQIQI